jgi:hypothetical protein
LGLLSGAALLVVLLRALIFALVFFILASGAYFLITRFLPELLDSGGGRRRMPNPAGSLVNITLDGPEGFPPAAGADFPPVMPGEGNFPSGDELGDISGLMDAPPPPEGGEFAPMEAFGEAPGANAASAPGLDQNIQEGYTERGEVEDNPFADLLLPSRGGRPFDAGEGDDENAVSRASPAGHSGEGGGLPELDAMSGDFDAPGEEGEEPAAGSGGRRSSPGSKSSKIEGDFDPKELAAAIRDRLKRD